MNFVIFSDRSYNYIKPLGDGLKHMLEIKGHNVAIYYDGIYWLHNDNIIKVLLYDIVKMLYNLIHHKKILLYRFYKLFMFNNKIFKETIKTSDAVIVVYNCPQSFYKHRLKRMEALRNKYKKPIINYDLHYLPNQGWYNELKKNNNFGLERFDWYLLASINTEYSIPKEIPKIYSLI